VLAVSLEEKEVVGTLAHVFGDDLGLAVDLLEDGREMWSLVAPKVVPLEQLVPDGLQPMIEGGATPIKLLFDPWIDDTRSLQTA
jgi:(R,R)-butanediol dehydrogenase/meso-butanediol dehydrogenase/diacetyl reductase